MSEKDKNKILAELTNYEAGGRGLADAPSTVSNPGSLTEIMCQSMGGAGEAVEWFRSQLLDSSNYESAMLFFVGAPGNGKSYLSRDICKNFRQVLERPSGRHYRDYQYELPTLPNSEVERLLYVVNDATPRGDDSNSQAPLLSDIGRASKSGSFLQANVNKGILYRELHEAEADSEFRPVVQWLIGDSVSSNDWFQIRKSVANSSLKSAVFETASGQKIKILAVNMDRYSLLERQPKVSNDESGLPEINSELESRYKITSFRSPEHYSRRHWEMTPAGELLHKVLSEIGECDSVEDELIDPIGANIRNLREEEFYSGVLSYLRAAELITGRHFSFRDLWTFSALAILGDPDVRKIDNLSPAEWVRRNQPPSRNGRDRLHALCRLSLLRLQQSICGANWLPFSEDRISNVGYLSEQLRKVDPCRDSLPGNFDVTQPKLGWATAVLDAFRGHDAGESILRALIDNLPSSANPDQIVTKFDWQLDEAITYCLGRDENEINVLVPAERQLLLSWYGEYLTRLFAVSHGISAYRQELDVYVSAWQMLNTLQADQEQNLDPTLANPILNLILPVFRDGESQPLRLISVLSPRARSVLEPTLEPMLTYSVSAGIYVYGALDGDLMEVVLREPDASQALLRIKLDFSLLREALSTTASTHGMTESSAISTPRIERFRASMIRTSDLSQKLILLKEKKKNRISL